MESPAANDCLGSVGRGAPAPLFGALEKTHVTLGRVEEQVVANLDVPLRKHFIRAIIPDPERKAAVEGRIVANQDVLGFLSQILDLQGGLSGSPQQVPHDLNAGQTSLELDPAKTPERAVLPEDDATTYGRAPAQ